MVIMVCVAVIAFAIRIRIGIPFVVLAVALVAGLVGRPWIIRRPIWWWYWPLWRW